MIKMGQQTMVKNLPRFLAPAALCLRFATGCPGPLVLQALARPVRVAKPALPAIPPISVTHGSLNLIGSANSNTLVSASLLRTAVTRHFSTIRKSGASDDNESVTETVLHKKKLTRYQPPKIKAELASVIDQVPWSYTLYKVANQYVLSVMCGTIGQYDLCIPLNMEETAMVSDSQTEREALAAKIRYSPELYRDRRIEFC